MNLREDDVVSAVALVESRARRRRPPPRRRRRSRSTRRGPGRRGRRSTARASIIGDPDEARLLDVPEVESDEMPDSAVEVDEDAAP